MKDPSTELPLTSKQWGYDAAIAMAQGFSSQNNIFGHAENLLGDIWSLRRKDKSRPLIFVGYSLGGLVIKQALIRSSEYLHNRQNAGLGSVHENTCGVMFLGTPHRGSHMATQAHIVVKLAGLAWRQPNARLLRTLEEESDVLEGQRKSFDSVTEKLPIACLYEEKPTAGFGMVSYDHIYFAKTS